MFNAREYNEMVRRRLRLFLEQGLVEKAPTWWQIAQGEMEMLPYVLTPDITDHHRYAGAPLGHPVLRQPIILSQVGRDHLRTGSGLENRLESLFKHLHFTIHAGMPVFDLQVIQTHEQGLEIFRRYSEELQESDEPWARRMRGLIDLIIPDASAYRWQFLEPGGWIDRAEAFDYSDAIEENPDFPPEFTSFIHFMNYCADAFPEKISDIPLAQLPGHVFRVLTRMPREGISRGTWWKTRPEFAAHVH